MDMKDFLRKYVKTSDDGSDGDEDDSEGEYYIKSEDKDTNKSNEDKDNGGHKEKANDDVNNEEEEDSEEEEDDSDDDSFSQVFNRHRNKDTTSTRFEPPKTIFECCFADSVHLSNNSSEPTPAQKEFVEYWHGDPQPWKWTCRGEPKPAVDDDNIVSEEETKKAMVEAEDAISETVMQHAEKLRSFGVSIQWLLAFSFAHDCWEWQTWRVVRDIVKPTTFSTRCRFAQLKAVKPFVGTASIFVSHCWGSKWGDTVLAIADCVAGIEDTVFVWLDVFAVRQWPGNGADLDFRGVIAHCTAVVVATSTSPSLSHWELTDMKERREFLEDEDNASIKKKLAFFRLWCIVELAAAVEYKIPLIIKVGSFARVKPKKAQRKGFECLRRLVMERSADASLTPSEVLSLIEQVTANNEVRYVKKNAGTMLINLAFLINAEYAECTVASDFNREMTAIRKGVGIETVNSSVRGVLRGAHMAADLSMREVDAAVCGATSMLAQEHLASSKVPTALTVAAAGGRLAVVNQLLTNRAEDLCDADMCIPLFRAAAGGHADTVKRLLQVPMVLELDQVNNKDKKFKVTPVYAAAQNGHSVVVEILAAAGAKDLHKALATAAQHGHVNVVDVLLSLGVDANGSGGDRDKDRDRDGDEDNDAPPLFTASKAGHASVCVQLIKAGAVVDARDREDRTPL